MLCTMSSIPNSQPKTRTLFRRRFRGDGARSDKAGAGRGSRWTRSRALSDPVRYGDWEKNGRCIDF